MKKMFEYDFVRRMRFHANLSIREIQRRTGYHRETIRKMLQYSSPPGYRQAGPRSKPKLEPFIDIIDEILASDKKVRQKKQRHTAKRIFNRLKEEHDFPGGYTIVKDYVREKKRRSREVFFPLEQRPGTSQTDFGQAKVFIAGQEEMGHIFCMSLPYSDAVFAACYPTERLEAVKAGHQSAYNFFDGVPPSNLYDNMATAVKRVLRNKKRDLVDGFLKLRSHFLFKSLFCNVRSPNEKGVVEGAVGYVRRNFMVPIPRFPSWQALNDYLLDCCKKRLSMKVSGKDKTIGELLKEERQEFLPLPEAPFEACLVESRPVGSQAFIRFQTNSYSVPVENAFQEVTVKAFVDQVVICRKNEVIARHPRSYSKGDFIFDSIHYLPLLERKPGALDDALPFSSWELPESFKILRRNLESRNGVGGKREYVKVLQLLRDYKIPQVDQAVKQALHHRALNFEAVKMFLLSSLEPYFEAERLSEEKLSGLPKVNIENTDASQFQTLLSGGKL